MSDFTNGLVSGPGRWTFPMAGGEVTQVQVDFAVGLSIETYDDADASTHIRISTGFEYEVAGITTMIDPELTVGLAPLLTLHKAVVEEGYAVADGHLAVRFVDGRAIRVAPDAQFESWTVTGHLPSGNDKFSLIGLPGGGVAVF